MTREESDRKEMIICVKLRAALSAVQATNQHLYN